MPETNVLVSHFLRLAVILLWEYFDLVLHGSYRFGV